MAVGHPAGFPDTDELSSNFFLSNKWMYGFSISFFQHEANGPELLLIHFYVNSIFGKISKFVFQSGVFFITTHDTKSKLILSLHQLF